MAHRRTASSTCTSATITASKRKQSTIAVTTKSHGKDSRAELGGELADALLFTGQRVVPSVLERSGFTFQHPTLEIALRALLGK